MPRIFLDGITPSAMPASFPGLAGVIGYTDGNWPDYEALKARYPGLVHVSCTVTASVIGAVILDVEQGDATPQQAPNWAERSRAIGITPVVYCNYSTWPLVKEQFTLQQVAQPLYGIAEYDGVEEIPIGAIYKQFKNTAGYDVNLVADYWPGVDPEPVPTPQEDFDMPFLISVTPDPTGPAGNTNAGIFMVDGGVVTHVDKASYGPYHTKFGDPLVVDTAQYQAHLASMALVVTANVNINDLASAVVAKIGSDLQKG